MHSNSGHQDTSSAASFRYLFVAQILILLAIVVVYFSSILGLVLLVCWAFLSLHSLVLLKDLDRGYRYAFYIFIVMLAFRLIGTFLPPIVNHILDLLGSLLDYAVIYLVCESTMQLMLYRGQVYIAESARRASSFYLVSAALSFAGTIAKDILSLDLIGPAICIVATVVNVVAIILYAAFLYSTYRSL